jgi:hypothetical protein
MQVKGARGPAGIVFNVADPDALCLIGDKCEKTKCFEVLAVSKVNGCNLTISPWM